MKKIEEAEALCANDVDQVSLTWEALIKYAELEKVTEELCTNETKVTQMNNEMKQLPLVEKMAKVT